MGRFSRNAAIATLMTTVLGISATIYAQQQPRAAANITNDVLRRATNVTNDPLPGSWLSYGRSHTETRYPPPLIAPVPEQQ